MFESILDFWNKRQIEKQKEVATEMLRKLGIISNVVVAGGAPRDWYFGKPAKDIDYYIEAEPAHVINALGVLGFKVTEVKYPETFIAAYAKCEDVTCIIDLEYKGEKHQIMTCSDLWHVVKSFPVDISKITFDLKDGLMPFADFTDCVKKKTMVVAAGYNLTDPYIQKIMQKFPDYSYVEEIGYASIDFGKL